MCKINFLPGVFLRRKIGKNRVWYTKEPVFRRTRGTMDKRLNFFFNRLHYTEGNPSDK